MASDIESKRMAIRRAYPSSQPWQEKVGKMSDKQVLAVYSRLNNKATEHTNRYKKLGR